MKRATLTSVTNLTKVDDNERVLEFQATPPPEVAVVDYPENSNTFWSDSSVHCCSSILLVRQYTQNNINRVYLKRLNINGRNPKFNFPSSLIATLNERIDNLLGRIRTDERNLPSLEGLNKIETEFEFENFWGHKEVFRIGQVWFRPFLTKFGVKVKIWQQLNESSYKEIVDDKGQAKTWMGPTSNITLHALTALRDVLKFMQENNNTNSQADH